VRHRRDRSTGRCGETRGVNTNRLESFSDGVIAVAVTLLVLNIEVPAPNSGHSLGHELVHQWPTYAAYATSFITIGIIWINHHAMISRLGRADYAILMLNLLLLLSIGVLPFGTNLIATYLREQHGQNLAAAIYAGLFLTMSVAFVTLNHHILMRKAHLLSASLDLERRRRILSRGITGLIPYAIATAVAAFSPDLTLLICAAIAAYYALPIASGGTEG
jgi:TMEM175 potassium channel family protein